MAPNAAYVAYFRGFTTTSPANQALKVEVIKKMADEYKCFLQRRSQDMPCKASAQQGFVDDTSCSAATSSDTSAPVDTVQVVQEITGGNTQPGPDTSSTASDAVA